MPRLSPTINLLVLKAPDIDRAAEFYRLLGLSLEKHQHGTGPWHYGVDLDGIVFEIYPGHANEDNVSGTRLGFRVQDLDGTLRELEAQGVKVVRRISSSPWGARAVVEDFAGHRVELIEAAHISSKVIEELQTAT